MAARPGVVLRGFTKSVDGKPALMSNSYLPAELANEPPATNPVPEGLAVGELALVGMPVRRNGGPVVRSRPPTPAESKALALVEDAHVLVVTIKMEVDRESGRSVRAAVQVVMPDDRMDLLLPPELVFTGLTSTP